GGDGALHADELGELDVDDTGRAGREAHAEVLDEERKVRRVRRGRAGVDLEDDVGEGDVARDTHGLTVAPAEASAAIAAVAVLAARIFLDVAAGGSEGNGARGERKRRCKDREAPHCIP